MTEPISAPCRTAVRRRLVLAPRPAHTASTSALIIAAITSERKELAVAITAVPCPPERLSRVSLDSYDHEHNRTGEGAAMPTSTEVLATIRVGMEPKWVALAPDGTRAYVTLEERGTTARGAVAVIDTTTSTLSATISVGSFPSGLAIAPDGSRIYVPNWDSAHGRGVMSVIDAQANTVADTVAVSGLGGGPKGVAITLDGRHVYVATDHELDKPEGQGKVSVIDTEMHTVVSTITIRPFPAAAATTPDGRFVYVLDTEGDPAVIDTATQERTFPFDGELSIDRIAFGPDGRLAYAIHDSDTQIFVIDVATTQLVNLLDTGGGALLATDLAFTPDGRFVYITLRSFQQLSVLQTGVTMVPAHPISWSGTADGIAMMPDGLTAYVTDRQSRAVRVIPLPSP